MSRANKFILAAGIVMFLSVTAISIWRIQQKNSITSEEKLQADIRALGTPDPERIKALNIAKLQADIQALGTALKVYNDISGVYPTQEQGLSVLVAKPTASPVPATWYQMMRTLPSDPWGQPYVYRVPATRSHLQPYDLFSTGADKTESPDDIGNWSGEK